VPGNYVNRELTKAKLYDLVNYVGETTDVSSKHPEVVKQLNAEAEKARADLGDALRKRPGSGQREPGRVN
jgi:hypothetical protein